MPVTRRQAVVAGVVAVVLVAGAATWWWASSRADDPDSPTPTPSVTSTSSAAPSPTPTVDPVPTAPAPTEDPGDPAAPTAAPPVTDPGTAAPRTVDVISTYAGWNDLSRALEFGAYVPVVETGGSCTLLLSGPGGERSIQAGATPDASTTSCGELVVPGDTLSSGSWQAVITYSSPRSSGTSDTVTVEVP
ncbi:hypothetical protein [Cellulomonas sp. NPDC089187]|uniref:hypothetical protein n=1 Tax=Cellulomonas sp. NPDC089187 TaxID=3154970 RepID=UPI003432C60D